MFKKVKRFIRHKINMLYIRWLLFKLEVIGYIMIIKGIDTKEYCDTIRKAAEEL